MILKKKIIFLNSPIKKDRTWEKIIQRLSSDNLISDRFELLNLDINKAEYEDARHLGQELAKVLSSILKKNEEITILSHGITCPVVIEFLLFMMSKDQWDELRKIIQVVFLAPIIFNEKNNLPKRKVFASLFNLNLRVGITTYKELNLVYNIRSRIPQIAEEFYKKIVLADKFSDSQAMVPTSAIYDLQDTIIHRGSIEEIFDNTIKVKGSFYDFLESFDFSFIKDVKEVLFNPRSHRSVFKIRDCSVNIEVCPLDKKKKIINEEETILDHDGEVQIKILFDPLNISKLKYLYRFSVGNNGNIEEFRNVRDYKNETDSSNIGRFEREGNEFILEFVPINSKNYRIALKVINGFDDSQDWDRTQDAETFISKNRKRQYYQFPIGDGNKNFRNLQFNLSLVKYMEAGFNILNPSLYHIPFPMSLEFTDSLEIESIVIKEHPSVEPTIIQPGYFGWKLSDVKRGTVLLTWLIGKN